MANPNEKCQFPAIFRYTWPGQDEKRVCLEHAEILLHIAEIMEFHLQFIQLTPDEIVQDSQCHQIVRSNNGD